MIVTKFTELKIWNVGINIAEETYRLTKGYPREEMFGLVSQMRRASVSIASNIAEGFNRFSKGDFQRFLGIALGSCGELETQLHLSRNLNFIHETDQKRLSDLIIQEQKMIKGFINNLRTSD